MISKGGDVAALVGPSLGDWSKELLWSYGATYLSLVVLFACTIVTLLFIRVPALTKADLSHAEPPRPILKLLQVPRLILALTTATVGFAYV